jgi:hypothetical protein
VPDVQTDADLADFVLALSDAGTDCRDHLAAVKSALGQ